MERRSTLAVGVIVAAAALILAAFLALTGDEPDPSPTPSPSGVASASSSTVPTASQSPSSAAAPSATAAPSPRPSTAAQPFDIAWEAVEFEADARVHGVEFAAGRWFALGQVGPGPMIWASDNGREWARTQVGTLRAEDEVSAVTGLAELGDRLVAIGMWGAVESDQVAWVTWTSDDGGVHWTERRDGPTPYAFRAIVSGGPGVIAAVWEYAGTTPFESWIAVSEDGVAWERLPATFNSAELHSLAVDGERIVAVGNRYLDGFGFDAAAWYSDNGRTWEVIDVPDGGSEETLHDVVATDKGLIAVGGGLETGAAAWLSADGTTWERVQIDENADARAVAIVDAGLVAVGNDVAHGIGPELGWTSVDGRRWQPGVTIGTTSIRMLAADGNGSTVVASGVCTVDGCEPLVFVGELIR